MANHNTDVEHKINPKMSGIQQGGAAYQNTIQKMDTYADWHTVPLSVMIWLQYDIM